VWQPHGDTSRGSSAGLSANALSVCRLRESPALSFAGVVKPASHLVRRRVPRQPHAGRAVGVGRTMGRKGKLQLGPRRWPTPPPCPKRQRR
jgi:hypothetical protein